MQIGKIEVAMGLNPPSGASPMTRRRFLTATTGLTAGAVGAVTLGGFPAGTAAWAAAEELSFTVAAKSPWMSNQSALTSYNHMFLGLPRYPGHESTPGVGRRLADKTVIAFPGNAWNDWKPGDSGKDSFVYVNGLHIFADDTVWVVDQGGLRPDAAPVELSTPKPGAQKVVQLHPHSGKVLSVIRFDDEILPTGAQLNDLRIHGSTMYLTDSGTGALIVHDLSSGKTTRRLSGYPQMLGIPTTTAQGAHRTPKADMIEVSAAGDWLYWAAPTGPLYRIPTRLLRNSRRTDAELATHIEHVADIPRSGGCAIDSRGNIYLSDLDNRQVVLLAASGKTAVLARNAKLISPDGGFISADRHLYIPAPQSSLTTLFGNPTDLTTKPFMIYSLKLPRSFDDIPLGKAVNGKA